MRGVSVLALLALAGCSGPATQTVAVQTDPPEPGTTCELRNSRGAWTATPPMVVEVRRSADAIRVTCSGPNGMAGTDEIQSHPSGWSGAALGAYEYEHGVTIGGQSVGCPLDDAGFINQRQLRRSESECCRPLSAAVGARLPT